MSTAQDKKVILPSVGHFINGQRIVDAGRSQAIFNPATGEAIRQVVLAETDTVKSAIDAAQNAFVDWRNSTPLSRARILFRFKELIE